MATTASPPSPPAADDNPEVQSLVAAWYAGTIGRRDFLMRATAALGTLAAATTLLEACGGSSPTTTPAATTAPTTAATRAAASAVAPAATTSAAPAAASAAAATQPPPGTTAANASASAATRPASSVAAPATTTTGSVAAGAPVATGVPADAVNAQIVQFKNGTANIIAYQARPKTGAGPFPAVIVIHENTGLTDHIKDVTRRLAKEGYVGLGVDFLSREGGTMAFNTPQDASTAINKVSDDQMVSDVNAAITYLTGSGVGAPKVGVVGFCLGGRWTLVAAEHAKGLSAAVAFYGPPVKSATNPVQTVDPIADAASLTCPLMGNYGAIDPAIPPASVQKLQDALKASGKPLDFKIFENTGHAFNNDTRPFSNGIGYVPASAVEAWTRTLGWFKKYLA